jgi:CBS domain-containing protein
VRISDVLLGKPARLVTLPSIASALDAATLMRAEAVGAILICDRSGAFLGVMSDRSVAVAIATHGAGFFRRRVTELMTSVGPTTSPNDLVVDVIRTMIERRAHHAPVIYGGKVVGIVSAGDLMKAQLETPSLGRRRRPEPQSVTSAGLVA